MGQECQTTILTVCFGGTLEWPPGDATDNRTFMDPFSAIAGRATTEPNDFWNAPTEVTSVEQPVNTNPYHPRPR